MERVDQVLGHKNYIARSEFLQKEMKGVSYLAHKLTNEVSKITGRLESAIHEVHTYIIG